MMDRTSCAQKCKHPVLWLAPPITVIILLEESKDGIDQLYRPGTQVPTFMSFNLGSHAQNSFEDAALLSLHTQVAAQKQFLHSSLLACQSFNGVNCYWYHELIPVLSCHLLPLLCELSTMSVQFPVPLHLLRHVCLHLPRYGDV